ncbi:hypothetical protein BGZ65_011791 [Modicella reniformis]|uniref:Uncharacterized protein n=1 Tax=Modicella reniformis TaxID=1440133 RepID=A0A9P6IHX2_9FUNG|nr:hypothetical protein BGZ65_011791 [Modicella reniformis]
MDSSSPFILSSAAIGVDSPVGTLCNGYNAFVQLTGPDENFYIRCYMSKAIASVQLVLLKVISCDQGQSILALRAVIAENRAVLLVLTPEHAVELDIWLH